LPPHQVSNGKTSPCPVENLPRFKVWLPDGKECWLLDFAQDMDALAKSDNPMAAIVRAHLLAQQTRKDPLSRKQWKVRIFKELLRGKWPKEDIRQLFRLIDWIMYLPPELEEAFRIEIQQFEEENKMPYIPTYERKAHEEGLEMGLEKGRQASASVVGSPCEVGKVRTYEVGKVRT
jgi:hypothetical protein